MSRRAVASARAVALGAQLRAEGPYVEPVCSVVSRSGEVAASGLDIIAALAKLGALPPGHRVIRERDGAVLASRQRADLRAEDYQ